MQHLFGKNGKHILEPKVGTRGTQIRANNFATKLYKQPEQYWLQASVKLSPEMLAKLRS